MPPVSNLKRSYSLITESYINLEFLLPNGINVSLKLDSEFTLTETKSQLWTVASKEPLFNKLQPETNYKFIGINYNTADEEQFYNENRRLRELPLLLPYLRLIEEFVEGDRESESGICGARNAMLYNCIGIPLTDIIQACHQNPEVKWARKHLLQLANLHLTKLTQSGIGGLARYLVQAKQSTELTQSLKVGLQKLSCLEITAWILDGKDPPQQRSVNIELAKKATVLDAIKAILNRQTKLAKLDLQFNEETNLYLVKQPNLDNYLLKICCAQAYLFEHNNLLINYEYVQHCIENSQLPCLSPVLRIDVYQSVQSMIMGYDSLAKPIGNRTITVDASSMASVDDNLLEQGDVIGASGPMMTDNQSDEELLQLVYKFTNSDSDIDDDNSVKNYCRKTKTRTNKPKSVVDLCKLSNNYLTVFVKSAHFLLESSNSSSKMMANTLKTTSNSNHNTGTWAVSGATAPTSSPVYSNTQQTGVIMFSGSPMLSSLQGTYVVRVGVFHGSQSLIECQTTSDMPADHLIWNKWLNFHIFLSDIPPGARLCVALICTRKGTDRRHMKNYEYPFGWANLNLFDHNGYMINDEVTLRLWPPSIIQSTEDCFNRLHPSGTVLENPNPDVILKIRIHNPTEVRIRQPNVHTSITSRFPSKPSDLNTINYTTTIFSPSKEGEVNKVFGTAEIEGDAEACLFDRDNEQSCIFYSNLLPQQESFSAITLEPIVSEIVGRDPLYELCEQEKQALWENRYGCLRFLSNKSLPWLTRSVCWYRRAVLMEFYGILHMWPCPLQLEVALQLLGSMGCLTTGWGLMPTGTGSTNVRQGVRAGANGIVDPYVRKLAVQSLHGLSDAKLGDYLLQLVQALKSEPYLDNPLTRFILYRALRNPIQVGLRLFWHLRSEMHSPDIRLRFGLLLEAFCHGCGSLIILLARQVNALHRLEAISNCVKQFTSEDEQRERFRQELSRMEALQDLQWLPSPLSFSQILGELVISKCDVKRSKKRPLWIVWTNSDRLAPFHHSHYQMIFKHGDDLRQDMLTLQLLRIMDRIWKEEGLDMCLLPYACLATGDETGVIEAVRNARTIMSIQGERLRAALQIDSSHLHRWLQMTAKIIAVDSKSEYDNENTVYERLIHMFTRSCAGYCVATFVLGIRDRHPDNIMVDKSGRLFHIDFGHILDNRKKKFGITRERVPFVLTKDFITVISRGGSAAAACGIGGTGTTVNVDSLTTLVSSPQFDKFTRLCGQAYLLLRKHSALILTLLAMMLPSGLPELTNVSDLEYVRRTLAVELDDQQALAYFHNKFNEAYSGAWTTKLDWFSHWMNT